MNSAKRKIIYGFSLGLLLLTASACSSEEYAGILDDQAEAMEVHRPVTSPFVPVDELPPLPIQPVSEKEVLSPAEQYKADIVFHTSGMLAYEAATLIDAEAWYAMKQPACDLIAEGVSLKDIEESLIDGFRQAGNDEEKASNMAEGFIEATTQPGVCQ